MTVRRDHPFELGVNMPSATDPEVLARAARAAEDSGFAWIGTGEHVMFHNPTGSALVTLAYLAGRTSRLRLLTAVTLAPLYPAALLAKLTASLSLISGGRLELGVGVGGEYPAEFEACGVDPRTRGARVDETIDVLRALWSGKEVDHEGRFWTVHGRIQPAPAAPPRLWVAGRTDAAVRRAVRAGDVYMPYLVRPGRLCRQISDIDRAGRAVAVVPYAFVRIDDDGDAARNAAASRVGHLYRQRPEVFNELVVAGTPQECAARLAEMRDMGCSGVHVVPICSPDEWHSQVSMLQSQVCPKVA